MYKLSLAVYDVFRKFIHSSFEFVGWFLLYFFVGFSLLYFYIF